MKKLTLLGIWNILPVGNWTWFNDQAIARLKKLTNQKLGIFCYVINDLNYECFTKKSTDVLKNDLERLSNKRQLVFIKKICNDYYRRAQPLEKLISKLETTDVTILSNKQLSQQIEKLAKLWSDVTMQIWYAVLLDIWYPNSSEKNDLKIILASARDHCGHLHERSDKIERNMYTVAAVRLTMSVRDVYFMIHPEIIAALEGHKKIQKKIIEERQKLWVESNHSGKVRIYEGKKATQVMKQYETVSLSEKKTEQLTGTPACRGNIQGKVRIITLDSEFASFKEGEILVTIQTMVHYLPLMKKAKAILTEFGGLTSHAAIVSRELNVPCIVGIAGLINNLQTGDIIEVNATEGRVKKISKSL